MPPSRGDPELVFYVLSVLAREKTVRAGPHRIHGIITYYSTGAIVP